MGEVFVRCLRRFEGLKGRREVEEIVRGLEGFMKKKCMQVLGI